MYTLEKSNTSPFYTLCTLILQIITLPALKLDHLCYEESTHWNKNLAKLDVHNIMKDVET